MQEIIPESGLDEQTKKKWYDIVFRLKKQFGKKPDLNGVLFLIGVQELGQLREFSKEEKLDLMHIAVCKVLSLSGFYIQEGVDHEGWPKWKLNKTLPNVDLLKQETFLKEHIVKYFDQLPESISTSHN